MNGYIGYASALWVLAELSHKISRAPRVTCSNGLLEQDGCSGVVAAHAKQQVKEIVGLNRPFELQLIVSAAGHRVSCPDMRTSVWKRIPEFERFIKLDSDVLVSSPEFCFLQMATKLEVLDLILLGYELCGCYYSATNQQGMIQTLPLTSTAKLEAYLAKCEGIRGVKNATRAVRYVLNNSYSPMETALAMILCLPNKLGGFGLQSPNLNTKVKLSADARKICGQASYTLDLVWPDLKFCIEYQGKDYHTDAAKDERKRLALQHDGWTVQHVSAEQVYNLNQLEELARMIAKLTNYRSKPVGENTIRAREHLIGVLLSRHGSALESHPQDPWRIPDLRNYEIDMSQIKVHRLS